MAVIRECIPCTLLVARISLTQLYEHHYSEAVTMVRSSHCIVKRVIITPLGVGKYIHIAGVFKNIQLPSVHQPTHLGPPPVRDIIYY